jgi:hypothetical protein
MTVATLPQLPPPTYEAADFLAKLELTYRHEADI